MKNLSLQDLQEAKEQLILEMADTLSVSRAFAESLLRHNDWSREAVMENMRLDPIETCIRAGLQAPLEPPTFTGLYLFFKSKILLNLFERQKKMKLLNTFLLKSFFTLQPLV